ncbi:hypothetical protein [Bombilactobacillus thymidiniphilus]|uniref:Surface layer protein A domain-containing protein n=1 Tax=Bombilactobacillus thymidiniphilus TaxID=2923363 RepID=A0ABY4PEQ3_9LACO|nr:hypothetical protein [Bombilactobacillus thymidiniphilus]UQS84274.1 hypothetical protein MOO47_03755 [Bombilactobacillus thymidiniphilus]
MRFKHQKQAIYGLTSMLLIGELLIGIQNTQAATTAKTQQIQITKQSAALYDRNGHKLHNKVLALGTTWRVLATKKIKKQTMQRIFDNVWVPQTSVDMMQDTAKKQTTQNSGDNSASANSADAGFKKVDFPQAMQGTWYSADKNASTNSPITFAGNKISLSGKTMFAYDGTVRPADDQATLNIGGNSLTALQQQRQDNWQSLLVQDPQNLNFKKTPVSPVIDLRGWYQSAGDGEYYYVMNENIDGQQTPVLFTAGGAGLWTDAHYYRTSQLAQQQQDSTYDDDREQ